MAPQPGGGGFAQQSQPSLFGAPVAGATGAFGQPAAGATGGFGQAAAGSSVGGFGGFGAAPTSAPAFGTAPASQPSLFGAQSQPSAFGVQSQPGLFGGAVQSQPSAFGAPTTQSQPTLFGAPTAAVQSQPSLFGGATQQTQASLFASAQSQPSLFGVANSLSSAQPQPSLFGGAQSQSSLFGAPQSQPSLFASATPQSQGSLFGASQQQQAGAGLFGAPGQQQQQQQQSLLTQQTPQQQQHQEQLQHQLHQQQTLGVALPVRLNTLMQKLDPNHGDSPFHSALYNVVSPADVARYQRPAGMLEKLFDDAVLKNPDPSCLVPVQANGFDDLLRRAELQEGRMKEHVAVLEKIETAVSRIEDSITTELDTKLALYRRSHRELARKLLTLASRVERKACANDTDPSLSPEEVAQRNRLDAILRSLAAPAEFKDKLNDLIELAAATRHDRARSGTGATVRDSRSIFVIRDLLQEQLTGISHLGEVCRRSDRHLSILEGGVTPPSRIDK